MSVLTLKPGTLQQSSFSKVGYDQKYDEMYFCKGNYTVKTPLKLNSGTKITGESGAVLNLIAKASTTTFPIQTPILGQASSQIEDITIENVKFNGQSDKQLVKWGKGYHNFFGLTNAKNVTLRNIIAQDTQGDILRVENSENIQYYKNTILGGGHDGLYAIESKNIEAYDTVTLQF